MMTDMDISTLTFEDIKEICKKIEAICPLYGCHVALTGGYLYKDGLRKDLDLLFYQIRQVECIDVSGLLKNLYELGFTLKSKHGWVIKVVYEGKNIDLFFPECFPYKDENDRYL